MDTSLSRLLDAAVGPAPWYHPTFADLATETAQFTWRRVADDFVVVLQRSPETTPVLALGFYARPIPANPGQLLVWRPEQHELRVSVFELDLLTPLVDGEWPTEQPRGAERRVVAHAPPVEDISIPENLTAGRHDGYPSRLADALDEVLLLAAGPSGSEAAASIYVWRPRDGAVDVFPQEWFTAEDFDLGYEWITKVVRDPTSGRIAGDGIRMARFVLADDGRSLAE